MPVLFVKEITSSFSHSLVKVGAGLEVKFPRQFVLSGEQWLRKWFAYWLLRCALQPLSSTADSHTFDSC